VEGFYYPNEIETQWGLLIVIYPYITGLVAGAFIVSSLYHVFRIESLKPIARLSLLTALSFLLVAPLPLLLHLGRPERGFEIFWTPHPTSAMSGFGYIWLSYLIILVAEIWFTFRSDIVRSARTTTGLKRLIYSALTLGIYDVSDRYLKMDQKISRVLAAIGIPAASLLHGYVGFIFGAVKANPWWSSPLTPFFFLLSAIVSGMALLAILYVLLMRLRGEPIDHECLKTLMDWLAGFLIIDLVFESFEVISMSYESAESWEIISQMLVHRLGISYFGIQLFFGAIIPLILLGVVRPLVKRAPAKMWMEMISSLLILTGVFAMRWNVVIGGQLFSKSFRGLLSYIPPLWGRESILTGVGLIILPFLIFTVLLHLLPAWQAGTPGQYNR
jgi:Ni/Fe-hydrogenase subunit HybB-like protein